MAKFTITLTENYTTKTYQLTEEMFMALSFRLEPYRSYGEKSKPVRCIETGKIFNSAMQALSWLSDFGIERSYNNANKIKKICKGKGRIEKLFGFHWRYADDSDREINNIKKGRPLRWLYYACLKNEVHSKSYKITEELFKQLKQELAPYCSSRNSKKNKGEIMKFEHILNSFNPTVTQVDLTEKDIEYIAMLISGVDRYRITELLSITSSDIDELYKKFGLVDDRFNLEEQMKAIVSFNNILTEDILNEVYNKYNVPECREFAELKRKAPKISKKQKLEEHEALTSFMQTIKERME